MIRETKGAWSVACARCNAATPLEADSLEGAVSAARAAGWLDQARKGKKLAQWAWLCPRCRPGVPPPSAMGRST